MTDEEAIRALIEARADAIRRKDAAAAVGVLADDVVAFEMVPPLALPPGAARDEALLACWFESREGPIEIDIRDLTIHVGGRIAFAHSLNRLAGNRVGGGRTDIWMRSTLGFVLRAEGWRIAHGHSSVPFGPVDGFRARLDLEP